MHLSDRSESVESEVKSLRTDSSNTILCASIRLQPTLIQVMSRRLGYAMPLVPPLRVVNLNDVNPLL
jgi:hypothetical protein